MYISDPTISSACRKHVVSVSRIFGEVDSSSLGLATDIVSSLDLNKDGHIQPAEFDKVI